MSASKKVPARRGGSRPRADAPEKSSRKLWLGLGLMVLLAAGAVGWKIYQGVQAREDQIALLEKDFAVELQRETPDLGKLPARIQALEEWGDEPRLRRLLCRIYLEQSKAQQAQEAIDPLALALSPDPEDALLGGMARLALHRSRGGDELLRQAAAMFQRSAQGDPEVEFRAWQCAVRLGDDELVERIGGELVAGSGSTPFARLAKLWQQKEPVDGTELADVGALLCKVEAFAPDGPLEWELLEALVRLEQGDHLRVLRAVEPLLAKAPAVVPVRRIAALALTGKWEADGQLSQAERQQLRLHLRWLLDVDRLLPGREQFEKILEALGPA